MNDKIKYNLMYSMSMIMLLLLLTSCSPDTFTLNILHKSHRIDAKIHSYYNSVEKISENTVLAKKNSLTSYKVPNSTEFTTDITYSFVEGDEFTLYFRTTKQDYIDGDKGIRIHINKTGIEIEDKSIGFRKSVPYSMNQKDYRIQVRSEGQDFKVLFDCDEIFNYQTQYKNTQYFIIETGNSVVNLRGFHCFDIYPKSESI